MMERLSPLGADAKSLRREAKRSYSLITVNAEPLDELTMASPTKRPQYEDLTKPKPSKPGKTPGTASAKRKAVLQQEVAALQTVVDGIQRQVEEASKGIQELKQLVDSHLEARSQQQHVPMQPSQTPPNQPPPAFIAEQPLTCVSPPASLMAFDAPEPEEAALGDFIEFPGMSNSSNPPHPPAYDSLVYYGGPPMSFSC